MTASTTPGQPSRYACLFEPLRIGPTTAPNRFYALPHSTGWGVAPEEAAFRGMRAEGGWGVVCTSTAEVSPDSAPAFVPFWGDEDARAMVPFCDAVHEHGALAGIELGHHGAYATPMYERIPAVAPSQIQFDYPLFSRTIPKAMERDDIRRVQADWVAAARRARDVGFDLVYVYGGHSSLPVQFLSPYYNRRTDEYGGSLENRARFWLETIELVREAIGDDCGIVVRLGVESAPQAGLGVVDDRLAVGGVHLDEALAFVRLADHLVDLWDVCYGGLLSASHDLAPSRVFGEGAFLPWTRRVREATAKPIVGNGRLTDADLMRDLVRSGDFDFVGAARPAIADPFLPRKIAAERFDEIRECIGCNQCAQRDFLGHLGCVQNPTAGEEQRRGWHPERFDRTDGDPDTPILIVGAGPAGMECARVLGRRGHTMVHLVDAAPKMGGHLRWFSALPGFRPWARVQETQELALERLPGVQFVPGKRLDLDAVLDYGAEVVIVATGAPWSRDGLNRVTRAPIPGADASRPHVLTPEQLVLEGKRPPGPRVVVYDCEAELTGVAVTQLLEQAGFEPILVSPSFLIAEHAQQSGEGPAIRAELLRAGVELVPGHAVTAVAEHGVTVRDEIGREREVAADAIVLVTQRVSDEALYLDLVGDPQRLERHGIRAVHRIGDVVAPRLLAEATFEGHQLGRALRVAAPVAVA